MTFPSTAVGINYIVWKIFRTWEKKTAPFIKIYLYEKEE